MEMFLDKIIANAAKNPDKAALVDEGGKRSMSYGQLLELAYKFATYYGAVGLKNDDIIIIAGERRAEFIAAELGAFFAGCGVAPINVNYPKERVDTIREDCHSPLIMTESLIRKVTREEICAPVCKEARIRPENLAFLIYTSGSTGKPKGIYCDYAAFTKRCTTAIKVSEEEKVLSMAPFFFVATLGNLFASLALNHTVHIASTDLMKDIRAIEEYLCEHEITRTFLSPQMLRLFVNKSDSLQVVATGSEKVTGFQKGKYAVMNAYGMSETLGAVLSYATKDGFHENFPVGKPCSGFEVYLVDDNMNLVPDGEEGEIVVSGVMANGYYNMPEATAKVFVDNPFAKDEAHKRLYHTGDIGKKDKDGNIVYVNRKDWMVKINGQRVEPGEIEQQLRRIPQIDNAVVKAFVGPSGQAYLCAYYIPKAGQAISEDELRTFLAGRLASYMIPAFYVKMDAFPLNQNNKIDRLSLKAPELQSIHKEYVAPKNEKEQKLCDAFEKVLQCGKVGVNDDFFALGGNSINVLMMLSECGLEGLAPANVFAGKTPAKIAGKIRVKKDVYALCMEEKEYYPLTDSQMGVYLECEANPESTMYNIPLFYRAAKQESLHVERLKEALEAALANHPILQMKLAKRDELPVMEKGDTPLCVKVTELPEAEIAAYKEAFIRPFDLENGPLCRAELVETKGNVYLLLDVHHLIFDGTSSGVLIDDMVRFYQGEELEPEQLTMFHQSLYEQKMAETEEYKEAEEYFDHLLNGVDTDSNLIPDVIAKKDKVPGGSVVQQKILEGVGQDAIDGFLRRNGFTENTLFMAAFAYTLSKFTNQEDVLFCTVNNGRHDVRMNRAVGMFVRTMPICLKVNEEDAPTDFLSTLQENFMDTMEQDVCSFGSLARNYGINSDIMFVYQDTMVDSFTMDDITFQPQPREIDPQANLTMMVFKRGGGYEISLEYRKDLYTKALMQSFITVMDGVLQGLLAKNALRDIQLLNAQTRRVIDEFNATETGVDLSRTVVEQFRAQAAKTPENIAVVYKDVRMSYRALDEVSERIGQYLHAQGIGPEDVVAILIGRSENMPVCALGTLKSGAAYQPLDPTYPPERLQFMVEDSGAKLLIADEALLSLLPDYKGKILLTKNFATLKNTGVTLPKAKPEDKFIMLYTSGTTGLPKGCILENKNLTCFIAWYQKYNQITEATVGAQYASFGFDACMMDMYPLLTAGGRLVIIGEDIRLDLVSLDRYFEEEKVSLAFMTTQVGRFMAENMKNHTLKHLSVGGEKLVPCVANGDCVFSNVYGPTETTVLATYFPITQEYLDVPIGKALDNIKLYVVDPKGRLLPPGVPGELWIAGPQVSRGYLNRPEQNEKAYTANPFTDEENYERVYHTGDIVRYLSDGNIQFVGRRDAQVKIRGFRVELSEVEGVIRQYPGIKDATVVAFDEAGGGKYIAAYVVSDETVDVEALNSFILERKPPYIVPAVTMQIEKIPLNQNYKVNKRALPMPERKIEEIVPPENEMQQKIFEYAAKAIGQDKFGVTTDLFYAGLTSIGAIKLNGWLSEEYEKTIKNSDLKTYNTVKKLEEFLKTDTVEETFAKQADYPLTQTQLGVLVECMAHVDTTVYNIPILMKLNPAIELDRLKAAVKKAVDAHPYVKMRLALNADGDVRARRLDADPGFAVSETTVAHFDDIKEKLLEPFQVLGGALIRCKIIHAESDYLFLEMHHIISDGTSMQIFLADVSKAYAGEALKPEKFTGFEYALSEEKARAGELYEKAKVYYTDVFGGCDAECLPLRDVPKDPENKTPSTDRIITTGHKVTTSQVKKFCEANKVTMNAFFTTAFGVLISKYCKKDDAVFTTIYNGRSDSRLSASVSMLVKTYPVLVKAGEGKTNPGDLVACIQKQLLDSMSNDIYSFAEISRSFAIPADIMFAYQGDEFIFNSLCGLPCEMVQVNLDQTKAPVNVNIYIDHEEIKYFCEYAADRYTKVFIGRMMAAFEKVVAELMAKKSVADVDILTDETRDLVMKFNDNAAEVDPLQPSELFEKQAALHPDSTAVTAAGKALTFAELNTAANRVAHALIAKGVKPETIVGLMLHRTVDVYAVREGILKSGGAFLSVEPDYPDERISFILEDSGAKCIITTKALYEERKELLNGVQAEVLLLEDLYACENTDNPKTEAKPENLAYCIYTSGSTGKPKGVMIERRNLMNMLNDSANNILARDYIDNTTVFLGLAAITFDVSVIEEMMPLYHGAAVAMATEEEIHNPIALAEMMLACGVDMMKCTPSYMQTIMDAPKVQEALCKLKAIVIGAEAFPKGLYEKMRGIGMRGKIFNSYGPTETTVTVTIDELDGTAVTIGHPCNNVSVYMLDKFDHILPPGVPGELTIVGKSVGRGYVGLPDKTKEKFIEFEGERAYRSGDIAYWTEQGKIAFCGRSDNQVKLRGLRVEIDEIENVMNTFPGIQRSVVLVKENSSGQYLCAYYTATIPVQQGELIAYMARTLTNYMIPSVFVVLEKMPMNQNGKIDKKALPEPQHAEAHKAGRAPATPLEAQLCDILKNAIGIPEIGSDDDFFAMGGTSLSASKVAMKCIMDKLPIVYANVFELKTAEKLAAFIEKERGAAQQNAPAPAPAAPAPVQKTAENDPYAKAESALTNNTVAQINGVHAVDIGTVLLTGATGFLGIHVLKTLLDEGKTGIKCLVRGGKVSSPLNHLKMMLVYYFDDAYDEALESRVEIIPGDITDANLADTLAKHEFDTVINCAACVKHFVNNDLLERVNVRGVENLVAICKARNLRFVQVSTVSVAGTGTVGKVPLDKKIRENELYFGQNLDNQYVASKFKAETKVLEAVADGMKGKIVRVGNLMSRFSDGEFQINFHTNGFMNRLRAYTMLGVYPVNNLDGRVEFSPIDKTAEAIVRLAGTPDEFTVFHAYNCHTVHMANVLEALQLCGITVKPVEQDEFSAKFAAMMADDKTCMNVSPLVSYMSNEKNLFPVSRENEFTMKALYRLGFSWPLIDDEYMEKAIRALDTLGFFDPEFQVE